MWLFTRYGFFSIASAMNDDGHSCTPDPDTVMVRARQKRHIENLNKRFPQLTEFLINTEATADYRYRIIVPKSIWSNVVLELVNEQVWSNFKGEVGRFLGQEFDDYEHALHRVWGVMRHLQVKARI